VDVDLEETQIEDCVMLPWFSGALDPFTSHENCPEIKPVPIWGSHMIEWFETWIAAQNKYRYHDAVHSALFGTAMYLLMSMSGYDHVLAAGSAVSGLLHDIGYPIMPRWLHCAGICTPRQWNEEYTRVTGLDHLVRFPVCPSADHKGHELVSLITSLHLFRKWAALDEAITPDIQADIEKTMILTILTTKVVFGMDVRTLRGSNLGEIKGILDEARTVFHPPNVDTDTGRELHMRGENLLGCLRHMLNPHVPASKECSMLLYLIDNHSVEFEGCGVAVVAEDDVVEELEEILEMAKSLEGELAKLEHRHA